MLITTIQRNIIVVSQLKRAATRLPIRRPGRKLALVANLEHHGHSVLSMHENVTMEEPVARIVSVESNHGISSIRHRNRVFYDRPSEVPF